jgi:hypothetical protein
MSSPSPNPTPITKQDVETLSEKMEVFAASLSAAERSLLGLAISNGARHVERASAHHFSTPLANLMAQATNFAEGKMTVPDSIVAINPGKLRAKDEEEFQGFKRQQ